MKSLQIYLLFLMIACVPHFATAQETTAPINTDRPDQSDGVYTLGQGYLQLEDGLTIADQTVMNNLMIRYGLTNSTEVRLLVDAGKQGAARGLAPLTLSIKQAIIKQDGWIPSITAVGYLSYGKLASADFQSSQWPYALLLAFENELSDRFAISYNIGTSDKFKNLDFTFNLGYAVSDNISTFIEYFATYSQFSPNHNIDAGVLYLISPKLQVDLAFGAAIAGQNDNFFSTVGIAYRFNQV